jgi:hypothetical protein
LIDIVNDRLLAKRHKCIDRKLMSLFADAFGERGALPNLRIQISRELSKNGNLKLLDSDV